MKLTLEQAVLQKALRRVVSVVPRRNTIPVLANVLIDAETDAAQGRVWIVATDLDMEAKVAVEAQIARPGRVTIEADRFTNIVSAAPPGADLLLDWDTAKDPRVSLAFGRSRYSLSALPADMFPVWSIRDWSHSLTVPAFDLAEMLTRSSFAASPETARTYMHGCYLHVIDEEGVARLRSAATDSHRLAYSQAEFEGDKDFKGVIVPLKAVGEFKRALDACVGAVDVSVCRAGIRLQAGDFSICSKVVDGDYVDYARVIPTTADNRIEVDRRLFLGAVVRTALVASGRGSPVKLAFEDGAVRLTVLSDTADQAVEEVDADFSGRPFEVGFNSRYLIDALQQTEADRVRLLINDAASPLRVDPTDDDAEAGQAVAVVMPQRV